MKKFWTVGFLAFLVIGSCIDPITLAIDSEEGVIVVDGGITDEEGPYVVNLFRSVGVYNDLTKRPAVTGAFVYIIDEDGNRERLIDTTPGIFVADAAFKAQYGKSYYLRIEAFDGKIYESTPQMFQPVAELDSIYFEFEDKVDTDPTNPENNAGFNVYLDATINTEVDYVRWNWSGLYEVQTFPEKRMINAGEAGRIPDPRPCSGYRIIQGALTQVSACECCNCWVTEYSRSPEARVERPEKPAHRGRQCCMQHVVRGEPAVTRCRDAWLERNDFQQLRLDAEPEMRESVLDLRKRHHRTHFGTEAPAA